MTVHIWRAKDGYRWRVLASNGRIVAESGEAYTRSYDCKKAFYKLAEHIKLTGIDYVIHKAQP